MTAKDNYSFEPVGAVDPASPVVVEAVPSDVPEEYYNDEEERPSDTAIMVCSRRK